MFCCELNEKLVGKIVMTQQTMQLWRDMNRTHMLHQSELRLFQITMNMPGQRQLSNHVKTNVLPNHKSTVVLQRAHMIEPGKRLQQPHWHRWRAKCPCPTKTKYTISRMVHRTLY